MSQNPINLLKDLIRINTTNPPGNEIQALEYIKRILDEQKIQAKIIETAQNRGNLVAFLPATVKTNQKPIVLLSHIDVVMANEQEWTYPPFEAKEVDGYIYGRGTVDTKQLTVMELIAICNLKNSETERLRDVYLVATADEESGSYFGLQNLLKTTIDFENHSVTGKEIFEKSDVISEGGGFPIIVNNEEFYLCESGQKGCYVVEFTVKSTQSKPPFFVCADGFVNAMDLVSHLGNLKLDAKQLKTVKNFKLKLAEACDGDLENYLTQPIKNMLKAMSQNTLAVTMIQGKSITETVITCNVRLLPTFTTKYLEDLLDKISKEWSCEYKIVDGGQGYESDISGGLFSSLEKATQNQLKKPVKLLPFVSMGSSDGRFLEPMGAKVYGYSPVLSFDLTFDKAISLVHGVDERIHKDSVEFGCKVISEALQDAVTKKGEDEEND